VAPDSGTLHEVERQPVLLRPTGSPRWLGAQIDHVFTVGGPRATDVRVLGLPGSDHRALLTHLVLPPN
jgi:endonuclease/exonuclease/phosphatase (EEP) superfamily protein YafD